MNIADSEEIQTSPRFLSSSNESSPQEPLSLVLREQAYTSTTTPPVRHWKKYLKDQASPPLKNNPEEQPENLCIHDEQNKTSQVAHALLSLGNMPTPAGPLGPPLSRPQASLPRAPFRPLPIQLVPNRPLNLSNYQAFDRKPVINLPQHPVSPALPLQPKQPLQPLQPSQAQNKPKKPYQCTECRKAFATSSGHAKHLQLHCTNQIAKSFSCKFCNKAYTSLSALKMHIRTHTLPCKCDICGKSFSRPWLLQGHVRTHTGEKPFACSYCTRSFADKSNLRAHLQTHLQTKKYSCPGCQKTFSRMSLLNKHTEGGCQGLQNRNEECVQTLIGLSSGLLRA